MANDISLVGHHCQNLYNKMKTTVSWGSKKIDVVCDSSTSVDDYMRKLKDLTGVPLDRQTLMARRKQIKLGSEWPPGELKDGAKFMLIGTAESAPVIIETVEEDLPVPIGTPQYDPNVLVGLKNFGNTCYLNACLQVFRYIPQLVESIKGYSKEGKNNSLINQLGKFFEQFPSALPNVILELRKMNPQFADKDPQTQQFRQQDASECWGFIMQILRENIGDSVSNLFEIDYDITYEEITGKHPAEKRIETDDRLRCSIDSETKHMEQGILKPTEITRKIEGDDSETIWTQTTKIAKLPKYLIVQMLRFQYRPDEMTTAKIVRRVQHPYKLDTLQWLAPELRERIVEARESGKTEGTGFYNLKAVLTHQGRTADSGHYISHVKVGETWIRYDDDKVKELEDEDMENLYGSGDWHCSFILLYELI